MFSDLIEWIFDWCAENSIKAWLIGIVLAIILLLAIMGPARISRRWTAYTTTSYGADFLVIKETMDGYAIRHWELKKKSVGNEAYSDGIYFTDANGSIVHLSGFYTYVQVVDGKWQVVKDEYLRYKKE